MLKRGYWEKGMAEYMDIHGVVHKVNPENGGYKVAVYDEDGRFDRMQTLQAGSVSPVEDRYEVRKGNVTQITDDKGKFYGGKINTNPGK